jgi:localization factor PodJL
VLRPPTIAFLRGTDDLERPCLPICGRAGPAKTCRFEETMPNPGLSSEEFSGEGHAFPDRVEEHGELKALIDAIAAQLSDATRRHSETLSEMQDRIATMGREAEALRDHIPEEFAPTFEHIEAGVAELAKRLAKANDSDAAGQQGGPWDSESAEALTHVYESHATGSTSHSSSAGAERVSPHVNIDQAWFETRFARIAQEIEQSLAEIRPDRGFRAIGERLDQFEQQLTGMLGSVATRADLDAVRLIEEHVGEVVNHLVETHDQLTRLGAIEEQLTAITRTLSDEQGRAHFGSQSTTDVSSELDVGEIARAAAEHTAMRFADMAPASTDAVRELRPLIERMMEENRNGGENTAALLDTLQQAMIRLLDRVDALEFAQRNNTPMHAASFGGGYEARWREPEPPFSAPSFDSDLPSSDSASVPPPPPEVLSAESAPPAYSFDREELVETVTRKNEKLRQDFIAEARRAKMRLSSASDDEIVVTSPPDSGSFTMSSSDAARGPHGSRPIRHAAARSKASGPSGPSPRLIVLAVAAVLALGGLWYTVGTGTQKSVVGSSSLQPAAKVQGLDGKSGSGKTEQSGAKSDGAGQSPDTGPHGDQQGQLTPNGTGADTNVSMLGVAVDLNEPVTAASMEKAQRHQAMATISGKLGDAAARNNNAALVPASMVPTEAETEGLKEPANGDALPSNTVRSTHFDIPVATVGPLSLRLAAANGDPSAEFEVGARLAEGKGTPQNFKEAAKWYQRSADQGLAQAQYRLGTFYERGLGVKADRAQAETLYKRAADQGNIKAMHNLAVLSANQTDQSPDYTTAAQWFEQAAKRGLTDSQFNLAILYENGLGVKKDLQQAYMWISLAARNNDTEAVRRKGILRGKLTADELAAAERMISAWKPMPVDHGANDARMAGEEWKRNPKNGIAG